MRKDLFLPKSDSPTWPRLLGVAAASSLVTLFVARNFFETEKKIAHRIEADYGVDDAVFERVMGHLMGPPLVGGNEVELLNNGEEIFPAMLEAIRSAERTITFENFLWHEGRVANAFAEALAERARAGVKVHVLQDAFGCSGLHGRAMNQLRDSPVELEIFRAVWASRINFRTHRKLLVVDGRVGFIGGVCIADGWEGDGQTRGFWRDTHYRVEGPVVAQLQQAFLDNWMQTRAQVLHGDKFFPKLDPTGDLRCQGLIAGHLGWSHVFHPALTRVDEQYGDAILSRYPMKLRRTGELPGAAPWFCPEKRGAVWVELTTSLGIVHVFNTHFGLGRRERLQQAQELVGPAWVGGVPAGEAAIVLGDFNSRPGSAPYQALVQKLRDARTFVDPALRLRSYPTRHPLLAVDHIFVNDALQVATVEVVITRGARIASDHFPVRVEVTSPASFVRL